MPKLTHRSHSGRKWSTHRSSIKVAKASLSQMPFHHFIVTRSPNHMWAISCEMTSATRWSSMRDARSGSTSKAFSRKVTHPRFSMAPKAKSGMAIEVELLGRVVDAEPLGEERQRMGGGIEGEGGEVFFARDVHDAQGGARHVDGVGGHQWADDERHQIRRHGDGVAEADPSYAGAEGRSLR